MYPRTATTGSGGSVPYRQILDRLPRTIVMIRNAKRLVPCHPHSAGGRSLFAWSITLSVSPALPASGEEQPTNAGQTTAGDMTLTKLADVELQEFPWGWIRWTMNSQLDNNATMTFGVVYIKPHQTNPFHVHPTADEILHVVEGSCEHRKGDQWVKMGPGDTIRIPRRAPQRPHGRRRLSCRGRLRHRKTYDGTGPGERTARHAVGRFHSLGSVPATTSDSCRCRAWLTAIAREAVEQVHARPRTAWVPDPHPRVYSGSSG